MHQDPLKRQGDGARPTGGPRVLRFIGATCYILVTGALTLLLTIEAPLVLERLPVGVQHVVFDASVALLVLLLLGLFVYLQVERRRRPGRILP